MTRQEAFQYIVTRGPAFCSTCLSDQTGSQCQTARQTQSNVTCGLLFNTRTPDELPFVQLLHSLPAAFCHNQLLWEVSFQYTCRHHCASRQVGLWSSRVTVSRTAFSVGVGHRRINRDHLQEHENACSSKQRPSVQRPFSFLAWLEQNPIQTHSLI